MRANKRDLRASIGFARNRSVVVMLVLTRLIAVLVFTAGHPVSMAPIVEQRGFVHKSPERLEYQNLSADLFGRAV